MFDQFANQFQNSLKPVGALTAINAKTMEQLVQQQAALVTGVLNDCVTYAQGLSSQKDIISMVEAQKTCAESVQEKVLAATNDAYSVITKASEDVSNVLKGAFNEAKGAATAATSAATKAASK